MSSLASNAAFGPAVYHVTRRKTRTGALERGFGSPTSDTSTFGSKCPPKQPVLSQAGWLILSQGKTISTKSPKNKGLKNVPLRADMH